MSTTTTFKTAAEAAAHLAGKPEIAEAVSRNIRQSSLVSFLVDLRLRKGKTQEQVAENMKCNPSKISRMESCNDFQLRLNDIMGYTNALGVQVSVLFNDESLPASARIKQCVLQIDRDLKKLLALARQNDGDDEMTTKISHFYQEVLFDFLVRYGENNERLNALIPLNEFPRIAGIDEAAEADQADSDSQAEQETQPEVTC